MSGYFGILEHFVKKGALWAVGLFVGMWCLPITGCNAPRGETAEVATKWEVHEIVLHAKNSYKSPYTDVQVKADFLGPDSTAIHATGFWDGENKFVVRFTPTLEGHWTFKITNNQQDLGLEMHGALTVGSAPEHQHGFVRRDSKNPYCFVYDDGDHYFMWGTTYYNMVLNALQGDRWKTAIDSAMVFGINKMRVHVNSSKSSKTPYPAEFAFLKNDSGQFLYDQPDFKYWHALDSIVQYAYQKGMVADLIIMGTNKETFSTEANEMRYVRYVISRYAAFPNVIWTLANEWNYRFRDFGRDKPYWNMLGKMVRKRDPWMTRGQYLRPLSVHQQTRVDFQFFNYSWPVYAIVQYGVRNGQGIVKDEWDDTNPKFKTALKHGDAWGNYSITYNLGHNMPVVNDEYGYIGESRDKSEATSRNKEDWPRFTREKHRQTSWGIAIAGGYGSTGDKNEYDDGNPYFSANWHSDPLEYQDIKVLINFFTSGNINYCKMNSANNIVKDGDRVYALAEPGQQYLFYSAVGNSFKAVLEPGKYDILVLDPVTGQEEQKGYTDGAACEIKLLQGQDWVVFLKRKPE